MDLSKNLLTRRQVMAGAALLPAAAAQSQEPPGWFDRPMRWAQLTLVENDPGRYDPKFWLDYFRRIHADAACLSADGVDKPSTNQTALALIGACVAVLGRNRFQTLRKKHHR